jgi:hypothetical protein
MTRTTNSSARRRTWLLLAATVTAVLMSVGAASAAATSTIEGIWSFNGGQIAVEPEGNGKFMGIVVQPTKFAVCTHPVGQHIWKEMTVQPDGSFMGFHQWYKSNEGEGCVENPILGPAAWRVLEGTSGAKYVRVCLSQPGNAQPTIPPASNGVGATYGCVSSALTAPLASTAVGSFKTVVTLPSSKKCLSVRRFAIHIADPRYDPFKSVVVTLPGHRIKVMHRGSVYVATINLKGLPRGAFTVEVKATTFRGNHVSGSRTYHTCAKKPNMSKPKKLA